MAGSPTSRTLDLYRNEGWEAGVVEKWNPHARRRFDLFGIIDIVAIKPGHNGCLGIQATSSTNLAARRTKALAEPRLKVWLEAGNSFVLVGWSKKGPRGKRKVWTPTIEEVGLADL